MHKFVVLIAFTCGSAAFAASAPSADTLKAVLTKRLQSLQPSGSTERQVLFQEVRAGAPTGGSYQFQVTAAIRDYGPGYPANRFYGETCVSRFDKAVFTLSPDGFGSWEVQGAMTPSMENTECKKNPAAGVSSIPLASLAGSPAAAGGLPTQKSAMPAVAQGGALAAGNYECWANGQARLLMNFSIRSGTQYTGSDGKPGRYSYDAASGRVTFTGGALDGVLPQGFFALYHAPKGMPTVSFRNSGGSEVSYCEKVR